MITFAENSLFLLNRLDNNIKHFKLFYDGMHYVGEKRFDTLDDLVADGLMHFYVELKARDYLESLSNEANNAELPYIVPTSSKKHPIRTQKTQIDEKVR